MNEAVKARVMSGPAGGRPTNKSFVADGRLTPAAR